MNPLVAFIKRIFSTLLRLYPPAFQQEFGAEMETIFALQLEQAVATNNSTSLAAICLRELLDLPLNLLQEHMAAWRKENMMQNLFQHNPNRLIWIGGLAFGITGGLYFAISLLSGLSSLTYDQYSPGIIFIAACLYMANLGIAAAVLWHFSPLPKTKLGFLPPALAAGLLYALLTEIWALTVPEPYRVNSMVVFMFWGYIWPLLRSILWGMVFTGYLGWIYKGREYMLKFALAGAAAQLLGYILQELSILLTYQVFNLQLDLNSYLSYPWFILWLVILNTIRGVILGVFLGNAMTRSDQQPKLRSIPV